MTAPQAAKALGIDESQVCRLCRQGALKARKVLNGKVGRPGWTIDDGSVHTYQRPRRGPKPRHGFHSR
jgi:hypothetical protein